MANRVTANEVREIFDTDLLDENLNAFIETANVMITALLSGQCDYTDDYLAIIEKWLAAHFAAHMDPVAEQEKMGDGQVRYALAIARSSVGLGLNNTPYGQQVKVLEYCGILAEAGKRAAVLERIFEAEDA